jgi:hypothetical protein
MLWRTVGCVGLLLTTALTHAQVNVCVDAKGRKTYTDRQCESQGVAREREIRIVNAQTKQCLELKSHIDTLRRVVASIDRTPNYVNPGVPVVVKMHTADIERSTLQYDAQCRSGAIAGK